MSRKALFFDIDGTLLDTVSRTVPESANRAIAIARECGHLVFVNTGRSNSELREIKTMVDPDGWLCGCGTYLEIGGEVVYHRIMPPEQAERICEEAATADMDCFLEGSEHCYVKTRSSRFPLGMRMRGINGIKIRYLEDGEPCGIVEKFCVLTDEKSHKERFFRQIGDQITVIDRGEGFYECVPAGHSKATAIDAVLERYGLSLEDAYVFGDSTNDIAMFEHAPNAVLMGTHDKALEPYATFVTKNVEDDGIWYAMEQLGLLKP